MAVFALTQVKGGVGTTTLAASLTRAWPHRMRILVELGIAGGDLARIMDFDAAPSPVSPGLVEDGFDFGHLSGLRKLAGTTPESWELPVLPAPPTPDFPRSGETMWWQNRADLMLASHGDVIADLGRVAPEHLGIHNRVLNAATAIVVVIHSLSEGISAASRLAMYQDRLAMVMISKLRSLPEEVSDATGAPCVGVLPWDDSIAAAAAGNVLVVRSRAKPVKQYLAGASELAHYLGGR